VRGAKPRTGRYERADLKTPRSRRDVPLTQRAIRAIDAHRDKLRAEGFLTTSTGPVFVTPKGRPLSGSWLTHRFYALLAEAGIERLPFKNLRTTFASRLADAEVSELTISTLMGHTRTHTTRKHYIAQAPDATLDAIGRLTGT
ncbi:MAG TPA: tyrosine-type recombinase/integrase, partial [Candidatus Limnocylindrales bacterium]|nr:tyrosine-type recombinase/integrase [Candidatus Limnocylindrales bacterium]